MAQGKTQGQAAELSGLSRGRISQLAKAFDEAGLLTEVLRSRVKIYQPGPLYDNYLREFSTPSSPPPNGLNSQDDLSPHNYAEKLTLVGGPTVNRGRLSREGWVNHPRPNWGDGKLVYFVMVYRAKAGWTATWSRGPINNTMVINAPRGYVDQATQALDEWRTQAPNAIQAIANTLKRIWGFDLSIDREQVGEAEVGFKLDPSPELLEAIKKVGACSLIRAGEKLAWADWSDGELTCFSKSPEGEMVFDKLYNLVHAAEEYPRLQKELRENRDLIRDLVENDNITLEALDKLQRQSITGGNR